MSEKRGRSNTGRPRPGKDCAVSDRSRELYAQAIANGMCVRCRKVKSAEGEKRCAPCRENDREKYRSRDVPHPHLDRAEFWDAKLSALGRCACGLLLPCDCGTTRPTFVETATARPSE